MHRLVSVLPIIVTFLVGSITSACMAQSPSDIGSLEAEVAALKEEVTTLRKELDEVLSLGQIKSLLAENRPLNVSMSVEGAPSIGVETAKLTIVEFSDFQCPYCGRHVTNTYPSLKTQYVETGQMKYVFRDFPLGNHKMAPKAAEAAHCAGEQDKFWEMHGELFANQRALQVDLLPTYADNVGVGDAAAFQECLDSGKFAARVETGMEDGARLRVSGTPSFGIGYTEDDGRSVRVIKVIRGAVPLVQFQQTIDELLEGEIPVEGSN